MTLVGLAAERYPGGCEESGYATPWVARGEERRMAAKIAYCVKCKDKREMRDPKEITMKNGRPATQGVCPECGTKMFKIGK
jgi:hypothetical protein